MNGDPVPDENHIARHCGGAKVNEDGTIDGAAFRLRDSSNLPEKYLSVNWLEHLHPDDREQQLANLRQIFISKGRTLGTRSRFAVHQVGDLIGYVRNHSPDHRLLSVCHMPFIDDQSHCGIYGLELDDYLVADLIAEAIQETHPGKG